MESRNEKIKLYKQLYERNQRELVEVQELNNALLGENLLLR